MIWQEVRNRNWFVFQQFNLLPRLTARNVALPLVYAMSEKLRTEKARQVLEMVSLTDRSHHKPNGTFRWPMLSTVAIARASK